MVCDDHCCFISGRFVLTIIHHYPIISYNIPYVCQTTLKKYCVSSLHSPGRWGSHQISLCFVQLLWIFQPGWLNKGRCRQCPGFQQRPDLGWPCWPQNLLLLLGHLRDQTQALPCPPQTRIDRIPSAACPMNRCISVLGFLGGCAGWKPFIAKNLGCWSCHVLLDLYLPYQVKPQIAGVLTSADFRLSKPRSCGWRLKPLSLWILSSRGGSMCS